MLLLRGRGADHLFADLGGQNLSKLLSGPVGGRSVLVAGVPTGTSSGIYNALGGRIVLATINTTFDSDTSYTIRATFWRVVCSASMLPLRCRGAVQFPDLGGKALVCLLPHCLKSSVAEHTAATFLKGSCPTASRPGFDRVSTGFRSWHLFLHFIL
ncbi:hypothetical protein PG996_004173 [Apiospora saccharicola]|uniref:Uncharacterized protein n=1 Tax=Apiospora saccharicola TaxID=335842 RepID=A0ABR1W759_9PEZI